MCFFNNRNQSTESTGTPKCEIHVRGKHVNYTGSMDMYMWIVKEIIFLKDCTGLNLLSHVNFSTKAGNCFYNDRK